MLLDKEDTYILRKQLNQRAELLGVDCCGLSGSEHYDNSRLLLLVTSQ